MYILLALGALFLLIKSNALASLGLSSASLSSGSSVVAPPAGTTVQSTAAAGLNTEFTAISSANQALNFVPVVGPALAATAQALTKVFAAASAARAKAATSENTAVAAAVPGWDQALAQIVANYNSGSISVAGLTQLVSAIMANYFTEVGPQIQTGRNGCQSGAFSVTTALASTFNTCAGSWGAACCVGYGDLWRGANNVIYAAQQNTNTGKPSPAVIPQVFGSKYGGINRAAYTVTLAAPATTLVP